MLGEVFDPNGELEVSGRIRPHWSQAGAIVFITFRTIDSIPKAVLQRWNHEKNEWLAERNLLNGRHWSDVIATVEPNQRKAFNYRFNRTREDYLDTCQGKCVLRRPELAKIVADSLMYFDGERYRLGDFVVMPNHVHLLAAFADPASLSKQCDSWLHFTAFQINKKIGVKGHFWQQEPFDHLVRSVEQYEYLRDYIAQNPRKSNLRSGEYILRKYIDGR